MADFTEDYFRNPDGLNLYFREYAPVGATVEKAPVICLHGLTRNSKDFEEFAPRVAGLGRRVFALDMRGRGRSDYDSNPARYVPPTYAADVAAWMTERQIPTAVFVGTSMGGIITMLLAAFAPGLVAGAVLNDIGPRLEQAALDRIAAFVGGAAISANDWREAAARCEFNNAHAFPNAGEEFWLAFARRTYVERNGAVALDYDSKISAPFAQVYAAGEAKPAFDMTPYFDALAQRPLLAVRGGISDLLSEGGLAFMQERAPAMRAATAPGVGHAPFLTEPAAWDAVSAFLQNV